MQPFNDSINSPQHSVFPTSSVKHLKSTEKRLQEKTHDCIRENVLKTRISRGINIERERTN